MLKNALYNGHKTFGYKKGENKEYVIDTDKAPVVKKYIMIMHQESL